MKYRRNGIPLFGNGTLARVAIAITKCATCLEVIVLGDTRIKMQC